MKIILATTSPYRQEAFKMLGIDFDAAGSDIDENFEGRPDNPEELVLELAKRKAESVAKRYSEGIVIGFDSIGYFNNEILEKPKDMIEAFQRLKKMSGNIHKFYTGIHLINISENKTLSSVAETEIKLRELSDAEINKYLDQDPRFMTYAIGFDPLCHYSSSFTENIKGSYNNYLRGIPLETIVGLLKDIGYKI
jgi:septum formation protein